MTTTECGGSHESRSLTLSMLDFDPKQEVRAVFGAYGIGIDPRHLNLIADYMTQGGGYRAMNRVGIETCTSPLLKMSFETAARFLTQATLERATDNLASPSSRIIAGRVMQMGTGCMDVLMNF